MILTLQKMTPEKQVGYLKAMIQTNGWKVLQDNTKELITLIDNSIINGDYESGKNILKNCGVRLEGQAEIMNALRIRRTDLLGIIELPQNIISTFEEVPQEESEPDPYA